MMELDGYSWEQCDEPTPELIQQNGRYGAHEVDDLGITERLDLLQRFRDSGWGFVVSTTNAADREVWVFHKST